MNEKKYIRAGLFYGAMMTISMYTMHKSIKICGEKLDELENRLSKHIDIYNENVDAGNANWTTQNKINTEILDLVKKIVNKMVKK